ncbi:MAG TPA: outer membrane beta-barrel protein [Lunatimonas sp.]|nr:outer membrane beta-barrel protein [Lunatimonas sp.]
MSPTKVPTGLFLCMAMFFGNFVAIAQYQINGKILDTEGKPVAYANIALLTPLDSMLVKGTVSEADGSFDFDELDQTDYLLSIAMLGYKKHWDHLKIQDNTPIDLQTIRLMESEDELEEIQVTAQLPLYEKKIDRMVINVQSSITSAGNSVLEVLQKSPGVIVNRQSNSLLLNGKSGVTIMINNRIQRLPIDAVFQMMDGMSAANIEKIELITNPPAKYDAEGIGGIIHLIMAESEDAGTNGNFGLTAGMNARETLGANFNLTHRKNKISFFADYSILYDHTIHTFENSFQINNPDFVSSFHSIMDRPTKVSTQSARAGLEWDISNNTKLGTLVSGFQRNHRLNASSVFNNKITADSSSYGTIKVEESNIWNHFTSNIHFIHKINSKSSLRLDLDYNRSENNNPSDYLLNLHYPEPNLSSTEMINISKVTPIYMKVAGLDYSYQPTDGFKFEAGVKGTFSEFENEVEVLFTRNGSTIRNEELSVLAFLEEDILAGYLAAEWLISESSQINGGLRFENTRTYVSTAMEIGIVDRDFGTYFPSLFYKKTINENLNLNMGYSRRIQRPTFNDLAPFVFFVDPNTFFSGNPALRPAIIDGIKTDINIKRANISFEYSHTKDPIAPVQLEIDPINKRQIMRSQNLDYHKIYSINLSLPWIINDWWDVQVNSGGFFNKLRTAHLEENTSLDFFNFSANVTNNVKFPNNFSAEITGMYQSKMNWGTWVFKPFGSVNLGVQKKLNQDKGTFRLTIDDIFYTNILRPTSTIPEYRVTSSVVGDFHFQSIRLNYTRNFGNKKLRGVNIKSGSEELQRRVQTN